MPPLRTLLTTRPFLALASIFLCFSPDAAALNAEDLHMDDARNGIAHDGCTQEQLAHACYESECATRGDSGGSGGDRGQRNPCQTCALEGVSCDLCEGLCSTSDCAPLCVCQPGEAVVSDPVEDGTMLRIFNDRREAETEHDLITQEAWVFFVWNMSDHDPHHNGNRRIASGNPEVIYDELFVAIHSLLYVGKTKRKIIVLTAGIKGGEGMPQDIQDRLRATGCCELRRVAIRCLGLLGDCHLTAAVMRNAYEALRMMTFTKLALVNSDIQIVSEGVDEIFQFPWDGYAFAAAPNGGRFDVCTEQGELGLGGYVNAGVIMIRPSRHSYRQVVRLLRCFDWVYDERDPWQRRPTGAIDDQLLLNVILALKHQSKEPISPSLRAHCIPSVFNCMRPWNWQPRDAPCNSSEWPTVFIRHFAGHDKPLFTSPKERERWLQFESYLAAHDRAKTWGR